MQEVNKMIKSPKTHTMTFRLTEEEYNYLSESAELMGTTASKFVRQLIQMAINTTRIAAKKAEEAAAEVKKNAVAMKEKNEVKEAVLDSEL